MNLSIWRITIFGISLALSILILKYLEYRYLLGKLSVEFYSGVIATVFLVVGLLLGKKLFFERSEQKPEKKPFVDEDKIEELELSQREYEVLKLIHEGLSNQEIADRLYLALPTIKTHTSNLYSKLGVKSRTMAISKATELNIL